MFDLSRPTPSHGEVMTHRRKMGEDLGGNGRDKLCLVVHWCNDLPAQHAAFVDCGATGLRPVPRGPAGRGRAEPHTLGCCVLLFTAH